MVCNCWKVKIYICVYVRAHARMCECLILTKLMCFVTMSRHLGKLTHMSKSGDKGHGDPTSTNLESLLGDIDVGIGAQKRRCHKRGPLHRLDVRSVINTDDVNFLSQFSNMDGGGTSSNVPTNAPTTPTPPRALEQRFRCPCRDCAPRLPAIYKYVDQCQCDMMKFGIQPNFAVTVLSRFPPPFVKVEFFIFHPGSHKEM